MADNRFFTHAGTRKLTEILEITGVKIYNSLPENISSESKFKDIATLDAATEQDIACLHNIKYISSLEKTKAGIILTEPQYANRCPASSVILTSASPYRSFAKIASAFYPHHNTLGSETDATSPIHSTAKIGQGCKLEYGVVIDEHAEIGDNTSIAPNTFIGRGVKIGKNCAIGANVTITHALIGDSVIIHTGVRIGQAGFGFHMDRQGHFPVPQLGRVIIGDGVDIGANTTIDRGSIEDTIIGAGSRIDNLVMIAHNVQIGTGCVIVAQVGISGSTKIGDFSAIGGQAGLIGHLNIGKGVQIAAQSGIMRDIPDGMIVGGSPAVSAKQWHRQTIILEKLANKKGAISV